MTESEVTKLIRDTNDGEQNRYGDIEYKLPASTRVTNLEGIAKSLATIRSDSEALDELPSLIYWALCDEIVIVNACVRAFVPLAEHPVVAKGFMKGLSSNLTLDFRHRFIAGILDRLGTIGDLNTYGLSESTGSSSWARLVLEAIPSWPVVERNAPQTQELEKRLRFLTRTIKDM